MAEARFSQDEFMCPVCLDLLKDPVVIPCGHSYCKSCITGCWNHEDKKRVYSCPQCRQTFRARPALAKNTMLAEVVEKLKKTKLFADCYSLFKGKRHNLTDATGRLQKMICRKHDKLLEVFCRTDQKCICRHQAENFLRDKLEDFCKEDLKKISDGGRVLEIHLLSEMMKENIIEFYNKNKLSNKNCIIDHAKDVLHGISDSHQLTMDPNTVNKRFRLSEWNRMITVTDTEQPYPDHPDRFNGYNLQVLCRESVCGRCYWELEWNGNNVFISVSYKFIRRKGWGKECLFGCNGHSWSLFCSPSKYSLIHGNIETKLPIKHISSRIGVYVDHSAGTLSFYSISDTVSLIHTVQTTFTQPLYPGFRVYYKSGFGIGSSVKLCR
uniref:Uncharacterized protein n=1 Tax=Sinocyclocheilus anshuiensis TaxID=1608454 RepID=A0A671PNX2_9TELE